MRERIYTLRDWLGSMYWGLQTLIFTVFIFGGVSQFLLDISAGDPVEDVLGRLTRIGLVYAAIFISSTILWVVGRQVCGFDLYLYYKVWLKKIVPKLYEIRGKTLNPRIQNINDSYSNDNKPVFVERKHLMRRKFWDNWAFAIVTILGHGKIRQEIRTINKRDKWVLKVDLQNEDYGIYSNAGKRFLAETFTLANTPQSQKIAQDFHEFMLPGTTSGNEQIWGKQGDQLPLRWASGGFLPIVHYDNRDWALLFFRDIRPIGLNVANGASESKEEYKNLHRLIGREFSEEVIILNNEPRSQATSIQHTFRSWALSQDDPMQIFINPVFAEKHAKLRKEHDKFAIETSKESQIEMEAIKTPFEVCVTYHHPGLKTSDTACIRNVIYSINPTEFGIEVIWLCKFPINEMDYILDGEYDLGGEFLIRRPAILLEIEYLREIYKSGGSLGSLVSAGDCTGGKLLPPISTDHFKLFDIDIALRHNRLEQISDELARADISTRRQIYLTQEQMQIDDWLNRYEQAFEEAHNNGIHDEHIRTLCPVTWKNLELIFAHGII